LQYLANPCAGAAVAAKDVPSPILIEIGRASEIFSASEPDPLSGKFEQPCGMDLIVGEIRGRGRRRAASASIIIRLTEEKCSPALEDQVREAIKGYCDTQVKWKRTALEYTVKAGWEALWLGLAFLAICLGLSSVLTSIEALPSLVRRLFGEGLSIAGWVGLWRPIELLLYDTAPIRRNIRIMNTIAATPIHLEQR